MSSLFFSNDVISNDFDFGISLFDLFNKFDLVDRVILRGVEYNNVEVSFSEKFEFVFVIRFSIDGSIVVELFVFGNFVGVWIILVFE